ncbi:MAG: DNA integrity scanning protein DisA nucleotide-binding domain protein, partial [Hymenobacteraceae bacterium]|nr:DNA integrity scanning protein DisA nucleotide-binding domain protein [Hymenobacteraceae bacterium]
YEGYEGRGSMLIVKQQHPDVKMVLTLETPTSIRDYRSIRKLLELSEDNFSLIADAAYVFGLGKIKDHCKDHQQDIFSIKFLKHYHWELCHMGHNLMRITYGLPSLPKVQIDKDYFTQVVKRIFDNIPEENVQKLWTLTTAATHQKSGTLLVISQGAAEEASRLSRQSFKVEPAEVSPSLIKKLSNIDGAIMIHTTATCHAIGVILDGLASEKGDPARGSRYNSAVRYVESSRHACLVVVVSEDGMIDLIPNLQPQIRRSEVDNAIEKLEALAASPEMDPVKFNDVMDWLMRYRFYLLPDDCTLINSLRQDVELKATQQNLQNYTDVKPNPLMSNSFYLKPDNNS